jgi:DNA primase
MPISWEELAPRMRPEAFNVARLLEGGGGVDAWEGMKAVRQTITPAMVRRARAS